MTVFLADIKESPLIIDTEENDNLKRAWERKPGY